MALEPLELACFKRNGMLTVDATIVKLDGTAADITSLSGSDIRWGLAKTRGGTRLATVDFDGADTGTGDITKLDAATGQIRIQFRAPIPPADPDPFASGMFWQECEADLTSINGEPLSTQFYGPVRIEPSMFTED